MNRKDVAGKGRDLIRSKIRQYLSSKPEISHPTAMIATNKLAAKLRTFNCFKKLS